MIGAKGKQRIGQNKEIQADFVKNVTNLLLSTLEFYEILMKFLNLPPVISNCGDQPCMDAKTKGTISHLYGHKKIARFCVRKNFCSFESLVGFTVQLCWLGMTDE